MWLPGAASTPAALLLSQRASIAGACAPGNLNSVPDRPTEGQSGTDPLHRLRLAHREASDSRTCGRARASARALPGDHLMILVTLPEPTVRPPSRIAKPRPSSMAIGWISSTVISVLSPGMTISVPSGSVMTPVTSVVRK